MKKRMLGILVSLAMALALVPSVAMAADTVEVSTMAEVKSNLEAGTSVKLTADVTFTSSSERVLMSGKTATLDLNGHVIQYTGGSNMNVAGGAINLSDGSNLTLTDSNPSATHKYNDSWELDETSGKNEVTGGAITGVKAGLAWNYTGGGAIAVFSGSTLTMNGGNIIGCSASAKAGGVFVGDNSTFNMNGGKIYGCTSGSEAGGVCVYGDTGYTKGGVFNMTGGEIAHCTAGGGDSGAALCVKTDAGQAGAQSATCTISGGKIYDSTSRNDTGVTVTDRSVFRMTGGTVNDKTVTTLTTSDVQSGGCLKGARIVKFSGIDADQQVLNRVAPVLPDEDAVWYTNAAKTEKYTPGTAITANTTLYAVYPGPDATIDYADAKISGLKPNTSYAITLKAAYATASYNVVSDDQGNIPLVEDNFYNLIGKSFSIKEAAGKGSTDVTVPALPEADDLTASDVTATITSLTVAAKSGYEYSIDGGNTWYSDSDEDGSVVFDSLDSYAAYTVTERVAPTASSFASEPKTLDVKTLCAHKGGEATCKDKAVCEICGEEYGETDPENHTALKHYEANAATETAEGNIEYWHCDGCDKYFSDADATEEIDGDDIVIAKLTPKKDESGSKTDDGSKKSDKKGSKKSGAKLAATGDNMSVLVVAVLAAAGIAAIAGAVLALKRN